MISRFRQALKHPRQALDGRVALLLLLLMSMGPPAASQPGALLQDSDLSPSQRTTLQEIISTARAEHRAKRSKGVGVLFTCADSKGKAAAQMLASKMEQNLYRVDLSQVVSKYIGETEKNLGQVFLDAAAQHSVLFFDEADALFEKRSDVKDSHDRYANLEINYLLQRIESYEGIAILSINRKRDIDAAFIRRLRFAVDFCKP